MVPYSEYHQFPNFLEASVANSLTYCPSFINFSEFLVERMERANTNQLL